MCAWAAPAQASIFGYFSETLDAEVRHAKSMRVHDDGILSLRAEGVELAREPVLVHKEAGTGSAPPHVHPAFPVCSGMFLLCLHRQHALGYGSSVVFAVAAPNT